MQGCTSRALLRATCQVHFPRGLLLVGSVLIGWKPSAFKQETIFHMQKPEQINESLHGKSTRLAFLLLNCFSFNRNYYKGLLGLPTRSYAHSPHFPGKGSEYQTSERTPPLLTKPCQCRKREFVIHLA